MTETNVGIWLVAGLAVLGLLAAVPAMGAHGNGSVLDNGTAPDGAYQDTVDERIAWMAEHMAAHRGINATEWADKRANGSSVATLHGVIDGHHAVHDGDREQHRDAAHAEDGHDQHEGPHDNVEGSYDEHGNDHDERGHGGMYGGRNGC